MGILIIGKKASRRKSKKSRENIKEEQERNEHRRSVFPCSALDRAVNAKQTAEGNTMMYIYIYMYVYTHVCVCISNEKTARCFR